MACWRQTRATFESLLRRDGDRLALTRPEPDGAAAAMITELADWRAATQTDKQLEAPPTNYTGAGPKLWIEYMRGDIPPLFGAVFSLATGTRASSGWTRI